MYDNPLVYTNFLCQHCWEQKSIFWKICLHICFSSFTTTINHVSTCGICHESIFLMQYIDITWWGNKIKLKLRANSLYPWVVSWWFSCWEVKGIHVYWASTICQASPFSCYLFNPPNHTVRKISFSPIFIHNTTEDWEGQVTSPRTNS